MLTAPDPFAAFIASLLTAALAAARAEGPATDADVIRHAARLAARLSDEEISEAFPEGGFSPAEFRAAAASKLNRMLN